MSRSTRARAALLIVFALPASRAVAQPAPDATAATGPELHAIVGATVLTAAGPALRDATVLFRGERIVSVTAGGAVPAGASRIEGPGLVVTPGFIATGAPLGLVEIGLEPSTQDQAPEAAGSDPVRAAFSAADGYDPRSVVVPVVRLGGVTTAVSTPSGGLVSGTSAGVDLLGDRLADVLIARHAALHVGLSEGAVAEAGGAMPSALSRLREVLTDAREYRRRRAAYDRRALRELSVSRLDLERLVAALEGRLPVAVHVSRAVDIERTLELGAEFGLRLVLLGVEEGWRVADRIAAADVPVVVQPLTNMPSSFSRLGARYDNPALLHRAGVRVIITTSGPHGLANLRQEAGNAVAWGLPADVALRALTVEPARAFGLADRGTIEPGRVASLVVWSGDPFEMSSRPLHVFVRGREAPLRSRQTALFERYRDLSSVRAGRP